MSTTWDFVDSGAPFRDFVTLGNLARLTVRGLIVGMLCALVLTIVQALAEKHSR